MRLNSLSAVRWLTFDIIGTVFDVYSGLANGIRAGGKQFGIDLDAEGGALAWISGYGATVARVNDGQQPWTAPDRLLQDAFAQLLAKKGLPPLPANEMHVFLRAWRQLDVWPDVRCGMQRLHKRFRLAVLSNMSVATQRQLKRHANVPFDRLLSAASVKAYKPTPAVYRLAKNRLCATPSQIMMVAAHKYDLRAAKAEGFRTAFVRRPFELGPKGKIDTASESDFDINADDVEDLAAQLGQ